MKNTQRADPYHKLLEVLGFTPNGKPPDHYRLLGLERFEDDLEAIKAQVDQRTRLVNIHRQAPHEKACGDLLYQINAAKTCLLNPRLKGAYDRKLRSDQPEAAPSRVNSNNRTGKPKADGPRDGQADAAKRRRGSEKARAAPQEDGSPSSENLPDMADPLSLDDLLGPEPETGSKEKVSHPEPAAKSTAESTDDFITLPSDDGSDPLDSLDDLGAGQPGAEFDFLANLDEGHQGARKAGPQTSPTRPTGRPSAGGFDASEIDRPSEPRIPEDAGYELLADIELASVARAGPGSDSSARRQAGREEETARRFPASRKRVLIGAAVAMFVLLGGILFWNGVSGAKSSSVGQPVTQAELKSLEAKRPTRPAPPPPSETPENQESSGIAALLSQAGIGENAGSAGNDVVEIGIAYGTEKRYWLEWAVEEFAATEEAQKIQVRLIPMGSLESAHAIVEGDQRIHVWAPASKLYLETFLRDWRGKHRASRTHKDNPIVKEEVLALTPIVIVIWKSRYDAFLTKVSEVSLTMIGHAMHAPTGWGAIAGKPSWGRFKFGHTHPNQSNSGLMTLIILAYKFHEKTSGLTVDDVMSRDFQEYLAWFGSGVAGMSNSTGNLMKEMILRGPSAYDALMVYESVAIDFFQKAEGRWDDLLVVYPEYNLWNDNPYYILDTPWTTEAHQNVAEVFLEFLMSEPVQQRALEHGFRPGNPSVPVKGLLTRYADKGLVIDLPAVCESPSPEVIENLQQSWIRNVVPR
jgi:hypothetical protein